MRSISEVLLFVVGIVAISEGIAILALARAVGLLQLRLGREPGALTTAEGLPLYTEAPAVTGFDMARQTARTLPMTEGRFGLVFVDALCGVCRDIVRDAGRVAADRSWKVRIAIVAQGSHEQNEVLRRLAPNIVFLSDPSGEMQRLYGVQSTPYAFLIHHNRVQAKGIVNHRDHLESVLLSATTERPSVAWVPGDRDDNLDGTTEESMSLSQDSRISAESDVDALSRR